MARISTDADLNSVRFKEAAAPSTPASGYGQLYLKTDGKLYFKNDAGTELEVTFQGTTLANSNISPTTADVTAAVNTRYHADVSGLTANRNFKLPAGAVGDQIELHINPGDDTFALIIIGDTGISINGGSAATEWSRVFITGEVVKFVAKSTTDWEVAHDGRIPCKGQMTLSAAETTNTAAVFTTPSWDNKVIDVGNMGDTTNFRFNIRRTGNYRASGMGFPNASVTDQKYYKIKTRYNTPAPASTDISEYNIRSSTTSSLLSSPLPAKLVSCAAGDNIDFQFASEDANDGMSASPSLSWFQVEEALP